MGKRIGIIGRNSKEYVTLMFKIWNDGNCVCLIDCKTPFHEVQRLVHEVNICECFVESGLFEDISLIEETKINEYYVSNEDYIVLHNEIYNQFTPNYSDNEAIIVFSSGTTGNAKGIVLSHKAINLNADEIASYYDDDDNNSILIVRQLNYSSTLVCDFLVAIKKRWNICLSPNFLPPRKAFEIITSERITNIGVNPSILKVYTQFLSQRSSQSPLKYITTSGEILDFNTFKKVQESFPNAKLINCYGLTECGPRVTMGWNSEVLNGRVSVGKPLKGVEIRIINFHNRLSKVREQGRIFIKTPYLYSGYANKENKTDRQQWFDTKDIGFLDEFDNLFVVARADDLIIKEAHKIFPADIEAVVRMNKDVKDCFVFAKGEISPQIYCIYETYSNLTIPTEEIRQLCRKYLIEYAIPNFFIKKKIIRNQNGKIDRRSNVRNV